MRKHGWDGVLSLAACCAAFFIFVGVVSAGESVSPEIRGMWMHRFEWPEYTGDPEQYRPYLETAMQRLGDANFNTVFFQVRGQADVLYPSDYEPWSPLIGAKDPGFDPTAFAIEQARKNGLEFHAYVNPYPLWHQGVEDGPGFGPEKMPLATEPQHLYDRHGPDSDEPWVVYGEDGKPQPGGRQGYTYLNPGHPEVQAYLRKVLLDFVERYDIDGLHYDRIRYPGPQYSRDPISLSRFEKAGNPNGLSWEDWQRDQIAKHLNDMAAEIHRIRPGIRLSGAVWGLYNRYHIPGYENFSSGYHDYYQDSFLYAQQGSLDTLVPMIYWPIPDPKPNYDEVLDYFCTQIDPARLVGGIALRRGDLDTGETFAEIEHTRKREASGTALFSYRNVGPDHWESIRRRVYQQPAPVPDMPWKNQGAVLCGVVVDGQGEPVTDASISVTGMDRMWTTDAEGYFAFIEVPAGRRDLTVTLPTGESMVYSNIQIRRGDYVRLTCRPFDGDRCAVAFQPRVPRPFSEISDGFTNILSMTGPDNRASINGEDIRVYRTGVFVYDQLPLKMGLNKIETEIWSECYDLLHVNWVRRVAPERRKPIPPLPVVVNEESIQPKQDFLLQDGDLLPVSFRGAPGHFGFFRIGRRSSWQPMTEESSGYYTGEYLVRQNDELNNEIFEVMLERNREVEGVTRSRRSVRVETETTVSTLHRSAPMLVEVTGERTQLLYGLGQVRLGGPILTLADPGIRLRVTGKIGSSYRVQLSPNVEAWVGERNVKRLPAGTQTPKDFLTSFSVTDDDRYCYLSFGLNQHLPHRIKAHNHPARLEIDLFGVTANTTWITHRVDEGIKEVDWEQVEPGLLRIHVLTEYEQLWGYDATRSGRSLRVRIKKPPKLAEAPASPVQGLKIAVEAGHGGRNTGARGLSGLLEKDVNRGVTDFLIGMLEEAGARGIDLRPGDSYPTLTERVEKAIDEDADVLISIHANSAGTSRGYLRVSGVSTYFKPMPWKELAYSIYDRLLEVDGLDPWGVIGSFNYTPIRMTEMPSMLVELAFLSHPGDEEILFDPVRQEEMARAIFLGLEDYLEQQRRLQEK